MTAILFVATGNAGKLRELRRLLAGLDLDVRGLAGSAPIAFPEEGSDYQANAVAKAQTAAQALGQPAIGDDSGLEVRGLGGGPGPLSARFGGPGLDDAGRVAHLLEALAAEPGADRTARFVCHAALAWPDGRVTTAFGECRGRILLQPRGAGGFGYDPVFELDEPGYAGRAMAELDAEEKDAISHRARAVRALGPALREGLGE